MQREHIENEALNNALTKDSTLNYARIFAGFEEKGIPAEQIEPRVNVFTFNAWRALGRTVRKGETGVKVFTVISCMKQDPATGAATPVSKRKTTTVFHISQTEPLQTPAAH